MRQSVTWLIGGEAGFGIMSSGTMLSRVFSRLGYSVMATNDYPSLIRGGHNAVTVRIATERFEALNKDLHILVALNKESVSRHMHELQDGTIVVFDSRDALWQQSDFQKKVVLASVPLRDMVTQAGVDQVMRNTIALGLTVSLLGAPFESLTAVISDHFAKKGGDVVRQNSEIAKLGYDYVAKNYASIDTVRLEKPKDSKTFYVMNGSEAFGLGAVRAGLQFAAIYPMTPINSLISFLADHAKECNLVYKQPEDEIAGIHMAIGASVAGVRSMVATSGGGFALMVEGLSLAGMIEVPIVIDLGMRVGPATGMPTYTEQGELQFAIHAGHGEFPRIILAASGIDEAYSLAIEAFNLADEFQVPVFVLTDKYLNESQWSISRSVFDMPVVINRGKRVSEKDIHGEFARYDDSAPDGVSAMSAPGVKGGVYYANSYEHDSKGHVTEHAASRTASVEKRLRKFASIVARAHPPVIFGDSEPEVTFVSWGTTKGTILEAMKILGNQGKKSRLIHFSWLFPFPAEVVLKLLSPVTRLVAVEQNATGQLASLIREHTGILIKEKILKYDGRPLYPEEIVARIL